MNVMTSIDLIRPPSCTIVRSSDGGPIRTIITGKHRKPTGRFPAFKAGGRSMPEESPAEVSAMQILEASTYVRSFLAQPHRLEMTVSGLSRPMIYFPDLEIKADVRLARALERGEPFGKAALEWPPRLSDAAMSQTIIAEVKRPGDIRQHDPYYKSKLKLARQVYETLGYAFVVLREETDLNCVDARPLKLLAYHKFVQVDNLDKFLALEFIENRGGQCDVGELQAVLGAGPVGFAKAHALHIQGVLSIDLLNYRDGRAAVVATR